MQLARLARVGAGSNRHARPQRDPREITAFGGILHHRADRVIAIVDDDDLRNSGEVQIPEHVARRQSCHQQLLGVVACRIPSEGRVGGARQVGLSGKGDDVIARVGCVGLRATPLVPGPYDRAAVCMLFATHAGTGRSADCAAWRVITVSCLEAAEQACRQQPGNAPVLPRRGPRSCW